MRLPWGEGLQVDSDTPDLLDEACCGFHPGTGRLGPDPGGAGAPLVPPDTGGAACPCHPRVDVVSTPYPVWQEPLSLVSTEWGPRYCGPSHSDLAHIRVSSPLPSRPQDRLPRRPSAECAGRVMPIALSRGGHVGGARGQTPVRSYGTRCVAARGPGVRVATAPPSAPSRWPEEGVAPRGRGPAEGQGHGEGPPFMRRPSADAVAGNGPCLRQGTAGPRPHAVPGAAGARRSSLRAQVCAPRPRCPQVDSVSACARGSPPH